MTCSIQTKSNPCCFQMKFRNKDKQLQERMSRERIRRFYLTRPIRYEYIERIHWFGDLFACLYSFTMFTVLFHHIYTQSIKGRPIHTIFTPNT